MKKLVVAFIGIGSLIGLFLVFALLFPREVTIKETILVDSPIEVVYNNVNDLSNWPRWMPWVAQDSTIKINFGKTTTGKNASYSWVDKNGKAGSLRITQSDINQIITELEFGENEATIGKWNFENTTEGTIVSWQMIFPVPYPKNIMSSMMKEAIRPDLQKGLQNLKQVSENE